MTEQKEIQVIRYECGLSRGSLIAEGFENIGFTAEQKSTEQAGLNNLSDLLPDLKFHPINKSGLDSLNTDAYFQSQLTPPESPSYALAAIFQDKVPIFWKMNFYKGSGGVMVNYAALLIRPDLSLAYFLEPNSPLRFFHSSWYYDGKLKRHPIGGLPFFLQIRPPQNLKLKAGDRAFRVSKNDSKFTDFILGDENKAKAFAGFNFFQGEWKEIVWVEKNSNPQQVKKSSLLLSGHWK